MEPLDPRFFLMEPRAIYSQGVSETLPFLPPIAESTSALDERPIFSGGVESFDWYRIVFLAFGVLIGVTLLGRKI